MPWALCPGPCSRWPRETASAAVERKAQGSGRRAQGRPHRHRIEDPLVLLEIEQPREVVVEKAADAARLRAEVGGGELEALAERARLEVETAIAALAVALECARRRCVEHEHRRTARRDRLAQAGRRDGLRVVAQPQRQQSLRVALHRVDAGVEAVDAVHDQSRLEVARVPRVVGEVERKRVRERRAQRVERKRLVRVRARGAALRDRARRPHLLLRDVERNAHRAVVDRVARAEALHRRGRGTRRRAMHRRRRAARQRLLFGHVSLAVERLLRHDIRRPVRRRSARLRHRQQRHARERRFAIRLEEERAVDRIVDESRVRECLQPVERPDRREIREHVPRVEQYAPVAALLVPPRRPPEDAVDDQHRARVLETARNPARVCQHAARILLPHARQQLLARVVRVHPGVDAGLVADADVDLGRVQRARGRRRAEQLRAARMHELAGDAVREVEKAREHAADVARVCGLAVRPQLDAMRPDDLLELRRGVRPVEAGVRPEARRRVLRECVVRRRRRIHVRSIARASPRSRSVTPPTSCDHNDSVTRRYCSRISGWWFRASARSATRRTNRTAAGKSSNS